MTNHVETTGGLAKKIVESVVTSGVPVEELLRHLESAGIDWYLTEEGD